MSWPGTSNARPAGRGRRLAGIVAVNLAVLVVGLVLVELFFGGWLRPSSMNRLNLVRGRVLKFSTAHLYPSETGVATYTRDAWGLRGRFTQPSEISLLTVGGSTTDQRYISDGSTWQDVLEDSLRASGRAITVGNAGVDGQSTFGHLKNFEWWFPHVPGLKPRWILFYVGVNDFYKEAGSRFDDLVTPSGRRTLKNVLHEKSAIYGMVYTAWGLYQSAVRHHAGHGRTDFGALEWTTQPTRDDHPELMRRHLDSYRARLRALLARTREFGAEPILVTQPARWFKVVDGEVRGVAELANYADVRINGVDRWRMMRLQDGVTCEVAAEFGAPCLDLGGDASWTDDDFYDAAHMTPAGARKLGEKLAASLDSLLAGPR